MSPLLNQIKRYYYVFKYTPIHQIYFRLISFFWRPLTHFFFKIRQSDVTMWNYIETNAMRHLTHDVNAISMGTYTFLNETHSFDKKVNYTLDTHSTLWCFHLNYFDYLDDFYATFKKNNDLKYIQKANQLILEWIDQSKRYSSVMWSPYTLSLRFTNWMIFLSNTHKYQEEPFIHKMNTSLKWQYDFLRHNVEKDIKGNHLLENYMALVYGAIYFKDFKLDKYITLLSKELSNQLHSDGCHYEKSFSYHIRLTNRLKELIVLTEQLKATENLTSHLFHLTKLMDTFSKKFKLDRKNYPLVNDSNYSMTDNVSTIDIKDIIYSKEKGNVSTIKTLNHSDYYYVETKDFEYYLDLGTNGPNALMAHSHNDALSFNLYYKGIPIIDDSGVSEYQPGKWRQFSRSTRSHNTVLINDIEQSDIWKSFRVGRRPNFQSPRINKGGSLKRYSGSYTFTHRHKKYTHSRFFSINDNALVVYDCVKAHTRLEVKNYLHFHEDVQLEKVSDNHYLVQVNSEEVHIYYFNTSKISTYKGQSTPLQGFKMKEFGKVIPRFTLEALNESNTQISMGYVITNQPINQLKYISESDDLFINNLPIKLKG